jgi:hypothetical protein
MLVSIPFFSVATAQKTSISIALIDSSDTDARDWKFSFSIKNKKLRKFLVQDTSFIRNRLINPIRNSLIPYLQLKSDSGYVQFEILKSLGSSIPFFDTCVWKCCNCINLKKGKQLNFIMPILKPYKLVKGHYRLQVSLVPPVMDCKNCRHNHEIFSEDIYFTIR